ncbi:MAG: hypothetical protein E7488_00205 [Ruminococcaceae bacterium]|nr:hypothetical protein [Oscillospiraceae bacterium]
MADNKFVKMSAKELKEKYEKPIDRIKHMSNSQIVVRTLAMFAIMIIISYGLYIVIYGTPIMGLPGKRAIVQAEISSPRLTEETVVVTDKEYIEYSRNIVSYLNKSLFKEIEGEPSEPIVTIKYTTKKGEVYEIAANETVLFYEGETYPLQQLNMFVTIAEGMFFPELADTSFLTGAQQ